MSLTPSVSFEDTLRSHARYPLRAEGLTTLQVNVGWRCNLACGHCHVEAGPARDELMAPEMLEGCVEIVRADPGLATVDITGGAPEMNPCLERFLRALAPLGRRVIVRSNLCILTETAYRHFLDLYRELGVELVGSLPDLHAARADRQRGPSTFARTVEALRELNARGYGADPGLVLNLVHNPLGAYLPASQQSLELQYRAELARQHRVAFNQLLTLVNMPIGRYLRFLDRSGNHRDYLDALVRSFNPRTVSSLMCRTLVSVRWDGRLYDCDFNQVIDLGLRDPAIDHIARWDRGRLAEREIAVGPHCFGCTAGAGSSCQGCLA